MWHLFGAEALRERSTASWVCRLARARLWQSAGARQRTSASLWELLSAVGESPNTAAMRSLQSRYDFAMDLKTFARLHLWLEPVQTTTASEHSSAHRTCPSPQLVDRPMALALPLFATSGGVVFGHVERRDDIHALLILARTVERPRRAIDSKHSGENVH